MLDDKQFQANLKKALGDLKKGGIKGVRLAAAHLKLEAQKKVPVDEGNLKNSAYVAVSVGQQGTVAEVGFTAYYAIWVHEAPMTLKGLPRQGENAKGSYWDPQGTATNQFLLKAFQENHAKIKAIIAASAKLK